MRLLHTSDWHVGKMIRGHSRADEHRAVLAEIVEIADRSKVDLIVVAGDLFETAAPTPEAESIVYQAFLQLAEVAPLATIAGNHDNPRRLAAIAPLLSLGRVTLLAEARGPADGGVVSITADDTPVDIAMLPFVSQRSIVRADQLMNDAGYEHAQNYADRMRRVLESLMAGFGPDAVNLVVGHAFVQGGATGGGERSAHLVEEYSVPAQAFGTTANYVALGHLHRAQKVPSPTAIHYCGSPLQLDFGEEAQTKQVNIVDLEPGIAAKVSPAELSAGRSLRTITGTVDQLAALADDLGDDWLRVKVTEAARAGLADEIRELLGDGVVDVMVERVDDRQPTPRRRDGRTPHELFADYLAESDISDKRLVGGFGDLYEQVTSPDEAEPTPQKSPT